MARIITIIVIAIFIAGSTLGAGEYTDTRNEGRGYELALTARYKEMITKYDQDRSAALDGLNIGDRKRDGLDQLLRSAIEGRKFGGVGGAVDRNAFISAVKEAYPDLKQLGIYDKLAVFVQKMRKSFGASQAQLAVEIQHYNIWRTTGSLWHPLFVRLVGFPSNSLEIKLGGVTFRGPQALEKMSTVVMSVDSQEIFSTSTDKPL